MLTYLLKIHVCTSHTSEHVLRITTGREPITYNKESFFPAEGLIIDKVEAKPESESLVFSIPQNRYKVMIGQRVDMIILTTDNRGVLRNRYTVQKIEINEHNSVCYCAGEIKKLQTIPIKRYSKYCNAKLGDRRCGINLDKYKRKITIIEKSAYNTLIVTNMDNVEQNYFRYGTLNYDGVVYQIIHQDKNTIICDKEVVLGKQKYCFIYPGCDKALNTCRTKFNNELNFRGINTPQHYQ